MTEFEFERGEILTNLTLLEDHGQKFPCPFCIEKHLSKVVGYAEEIAMGKEGDEKEMEQLAEFAREWRRKLQGAKEHKHTDRGTHPLTNNSHGLSKCEKKQARCIEKVELKCCGEHTKDYGECTCNPVAVCRASVPCS